MVWGTQIGCLIDALVHETARENEVVEARHRAFILSHLCGGLIAIAILPFYLVFAGMPGFFEAMAFAWLASPFAFGLYLSKTGKLERAHLMSAVSLAGLVGCVASLTGGVASFVIAWIAVVPVEAALSGSRRIIGFAVTVSALVLSSLVAAGTFGYLPAPYVFPNPDMLTAIGIVSALGYIGGLALSIQDINRRAMDVLTRSEAQYRLMADNATDLITCHDVNGAVTFASGALETLCDSASDEIAGQCLVDLIHVADRPAYLHAFSTTIETGQAVTAEFRVASKVSRDHGEIPEYRWVEMRCRRLPAAELLGGRGEIVAIMRDVTERKNYQLELIKSRDQADAANLAKTHFLAKVSHELRTPLNAIIGFSDILKAELSEVDGNAQRVEYTGLINQSGAHLLDVVDGLMNMSKLEAGEFEINPEEFKLNDCVRTIIDTMRPMADTAKVQLSTTETDGDVEIFADQRAVRQMLLNLISNAIKFTPEGGEVTISTLSRDGATGFCVSDTGVGIPADVMPRITDAFIQADNGFDRSHDGTGLGLSVVKGFVELHGGRLHIDSAIGRGTRVSVVLPDHEGARSTGRGISERVPLMQAEPLRNAG